MYQQHSTINNVRLNDTINADCPNDTILSNNNMILDIQFDRNRDELITFNYNLMETRERDPLLNLYSYDEIADQMICEQQHIQVESKKLSYHKRNLKQTSKGHNGHLNLQFNVNGQEKRGFKDRELLDKVICERNLHFKSPDRYSIIYLYIWQDDLIIYMYYKIEEFQGQIIINTEQKTVICPIEYDKSTICPDDSCIQVLESIQDMADYLINVLEITGIDKQTGNQQLMFIIGNQMNNSKENRLLQLLTIYDKKISYTYKYNYNSKVNIIKQITNIPQLYNTYLLDMDSLSKPHHLINIGIFKDQITQVQQDNVIQVMLKKMDYLQVPLSYILYETDTNNLQSYVFRNYLNNGYMFFYDSSLIQKQKLKIDGGMYIQAPVELQQVILTNIAEGDYSALYSTIILAKNISPETISKVSNSETDKCIDKVQRELKITISTKQGIVPMIVQELLKIRKNATSQIENAAVKRILSISFGIFGSEHYSLYNAICASAITKYGRLACQLAKECLQDSNIGICKTSVIQQQTDSCIFQITDECIKNPQLLQLKWAQLNFNINNHEDIKPTNNLFEFKFEYSKFATKMIIPRAKNTKVSNVCYWDKQYGINDQNSSICRSGDLYSQYYSIQKNKVILNYFTNLFNDPTWKEGDKLSLYMNCTCFNSIQSQLFTVNNTYIQKERIQQFIETTALNSTQLQILNDILECGQLSISHDLSEQLMLNSQCTSPFCYEFIYREQVNIFQSLIDKQNIEEIVQNYSIFLKYSPDDTRCQYIEKTFNIKQSCRYLYFGDKIIPAHLLEKSYILKLRVHETINDILRPIKGLISGERADSMSKSQLYTSGFEESIRSYARINEIDMRELEDGQGMLKPKKNQCILRVESAQERRFIIQSFDDIQQLVIDNPQTSFHEVLFRKFNKMYLDVDSKYPIDEYAMQYTITFILKKLLDVTINNIIHKVCASSQQSKKAVTSFDIGTKMSQITQVQQEQHISSLKISYHFIIDIKCSAALNLFLAEQMNRKYQQMIGKYGNEYDIFDVSVYKNKNQSLRLPMCVKILNDNQVDKRPFKIVSDSIFRDFIITDTSRCLLEFDHIIHFDKINPIDPATFCDKIHQLANLMDDSTLIQIIAKRTNSNESTWKLKGSRIVCSGAYQCFVCGGNHTSDNLTINVSLDGKQAFVDCYSNILRKKKIHNPVCIYQDKSQESTIQTFIPAQKATFTSLFNQINEQDPFGTTITQQVHQQFIQFNMVKPTLYVISDMGTGKSQQIKRILSDLDKQQSVLCLSFRRTFSIEFAAKYDLVNYMDKKGRLNSKLHKKLIVQVDSLTRYDLVEFPQLLIIDEIESILERLYTCKDNYELTDKFLKLIKNSTNVVYMDGLIERTTIDYLNIFRGVTQQDVDVVYNSFSPRCDYNYVIYPYNPNYNLHIANYLINLTVVQKKKVYGMVTSKKLGFYLQQQLEEQGISTIFYHGCDNKQESLIHQSGEVTIHSHIYVKKIHFKDVNLHWRNYQVVLHNSAITAGVSYDHQPIDANNFDIQVNVYSSDTTTPLSFFQGCHRVRYLKDKTVVTFLEPQYKKAHMCTPLSVFARELVIDNSSNIGIDCDYDFSKQKQLQLWMRARYECSIAFKIHILFKYLKRMNYRVIIQNQGSDIPMSQDLKSLIEQSNGAETTICKNVDQSDNKPQLVLSQDNNISIVKRNYNHQMPSAVSTKQTQNMPLLDQISINSHQLDSSLNISKDDMQQIIDRLIPLIKYNDDIVGKRLDIEKLFDYYIKEQHIDQSHYNLYDDAYKTNFINKHTNNEAYYILEKLAIKTTYGIEFDTINEMSEAQIKKLRKHIDDQIFRNDLTSLFANNMDPKQSIDWMLNIMSHYKNVRNNNKLVNGDITYQVNLITTVTGLVYKYKQNIVHLRSSLLCDLKTLTILLNECRHKVWIKINNNMKLPDIIKGLKYALSFLYIDINATSDDPNQCNLDINNITSHMYEHILQN